MVKILFFSAFIFSTSHAVLLTGTGGKDCNKIKASYEVVEESGGSKVTVKAEGGAAPYKYIFYRESGNLLSEAFDSNSVENLQKGRYFCTIADNRSCRKTIEIEIK